MIAPTKPQQDIVPSTEVSLTNECRISWMRVGGMVDVQSRTWPGINKHGGVGRIVKLHYVSSNECVDDKNEVTHIDVKYLVMGGRERMVPVQYVNPAPEYETTTTTTQVSTAATEKTKNLRDRSVLLGRCKLCGSLRQDCGSCDWVAQQRQAAIFKRNLDESVLVKEQTTNQQALKRRRRRLRQSRQSVIPSSSSSSSSDEELIRLFRMRRQRTKEKESLHQIDAGDSDSSVESGRIVQTSYGRIIRNSYDANESSSDDSSDPILSRLTELSTFPRFRDRSHRYNQYRQRGSPKLNRFRLPKHPQRTQRAEHSVLENFDTEKVSSICPSNPIKKKWKGLPQKAVSTRKGAQGSILSDQNYSTVEDVGSPDMLPLRSRKRVFPAVGAPIRNEEESFPDFAEAPEEEFQSPSDLHHLDDFMQPLRDFIQPEGAEVAENLPEDTKDRTAAVAYGELPDFFDRMATELSDDVLPDAKIRFAKFKNQLKLASSNGNCETLEGRKDMVRVEKNGYALYDELKRLLIREGKDQCQIALHRLMDSRQRRLHKNKVTKDEWKPFRQTAMELRDIQLDELGRAIEELIREVKQIIEGYASAIDQNGSENSETSNDDDSIDIYLTQDVVDHHKMQPQSSTTANFQSDLTLPEFDPHMYASRVRSKKWLPKEKKRMNINYAKEKESRNVSSGFLAEGTKNKRKPRRLTESIQNRKNGNKLNATNHGDHRSLDESDSPLSHSSVFSQAEDNTESLQAVPPLESLFVSHASSHAGADVGLTNAENRKLLSYRQPQAPINDRMQAFLDANSSNVDAHIHHVPSLSQNEECGSSSKLNARTHRSSSKMHRGRRYDGRSTSIGIGRRWAGGNTMGQSVTREDVSSDSMSGRDSDTKSRNELSSRRMYCRLLDPVCPQLEIVTATSSSRSLPESCSCLAQNYPKSPRLWWEAFDEIFSQVLNTSQPDASIVFRTILGLMNRQGSNTLQAMLYSDNPALSEHIRLLIRTLSLIEHNVHRYLKPEDGDIYEVFAPRPTCKFVEMLTLQLIDVAYSRLLPSAWNVQPRGCREALGKFSSVRDALVKVTPLVETASRLIMSRLECQRWWEADFGSQYFVSSVDPKTYASFLRTGLLLSPRPESIRFAMFKGSLPRIEICTLWSLIAFFAKGRQSPSEQRALSHWRLIRTLLHSKAGVLADEAVAPSIGGEDPLPPSEAHISSCVAEVGHLIILLSIGVMDPLPETDGMMSKIVQKSCLLQADEYKSKLRSQSCMFPSIPTQNDLQLVMQLWNKTNMAVKPPANLTENYSAPRDNFYPFCLDATLEKSVAMITLLPASRILRRCIALVISWSQRLPKKKARWSRFNATVQKLISDFDDLALHEKGKEVTSGSRQPNDSFAEAFSVTSSNGSKGNIASSKDIFYREGSAHLRIALAVTTIMCKELVSGASPPSVVLTKNLRENVWKVLSNESMNQKRESILRRSDSSNLRSVYGGDAARLYASAKAMTLLALLHLGVLPADMESTKHQFTPCSSRLLSGAEIDDGVLIFLISAIVSCLDCVCDLFEVANGRHDPYNLSRYSESRSDSTATPSELARIISCICSWLCMICMRSCFILEQIKSMSDRVLEKVKESIQAVGTLVVDIVGDSLTRSLLCVTGSVDLGLTGDMCVRSCLSALRGAISVAAQCDECTTHMRSTGVALVDASNERNAQPDAFTTDKCDEDLFGSLNDDLLLSIDLDMVSNKGNERSQPTLSQGESHIGVMPEIVVSVMSAKIWTALMNYIEQSKPSNRFAILTPVSQNPNGTIPVSIQGRSLVARHTGGICGCLAAICALDLHGTGQVRVSLVPLLRPVPRLSLSLDQQKSDGMYVNHLAQCFGSEVCHLAERFPGCDKLVNDKVSYFFGQLVDALLDSGTLERFPSCNLKRIKASGGIRSEQKESARLVLVNEVAQQERDKDTIGGETVCLDVEGTSLRRRRGELADCPGPVYNSTHLWEFCRNLGATLDRAYTGSSIINSPALLSSQIGKVLSAIGSRLPVESSAMLGLVSMERECLKRFKVLREIISTIALTHSGTRVHPMDSVFNYEQISSMIISSSMHQLICVSEGVRYYERMLEDKQEVMESNSSTKDIHKRAKLSELQNSYARLMVGIQSWILRESGKHCSQSFDELLRHIRESLFSKILQRQDIHIHSSLQQIYHLASIRAGNVGNWMHSGTVSPNIDCSNSLIGTLHQAIIGRIRELMMHVALGYSQSNTLSCLYGALISTGIETTAPPKDSKHDEEARYRSELVGRAFYNIKDAATVPFRYNLPTDERCLCQEAIDDYLDFYQLSRPSEVSEVDAVSLDSLRQLAVNRFLLLKFNHAATLVSRKQNIIRLLTQMLIMEKGEQKRLDADLEKPITFGPLVACIVAKGLASCLRDSIEFGSVGSDIIVNVFECARCLVDIRVEFSHKEADSTHRGENLLDWSQSRSRSMLLLRALSYSDVTSRNFLSTYILAFFVWLKDIGILLSGQNQQELRLLNAFRKEANEFKTKKKSIWTAASRTVLIDDKCTKAILEASRQIKELEEMIFPEKDNVTAITNVYANKAKSSMSVSDIAIRESFWTPTSGVRRATKEYLAAFIDAS